MPIDKSMTLSTVFVIGGQESGRKAMGTGFFVTLASEIAGLDPHGYVVTCAHVVRPELDRGHETALRFRMTNDELHPDVVVTDWRFPLGDEIDLAVAPFDAADVDVTGLSLERKWLPEDVARRMLLGMPVNYIGLLTRFQAMELEAVPMVRTGTIGALYREGLRYPETPGDRKSRWYNYRGHLVDCRSYEGFSGSPLYVEFEFVSLVDRGLPFPTPEGYKLGPMGAPHQFNFLFGMITGHLRNYYSGVEDPDGAMNRYGVATVLPVEYIREALMSDELVNERRKKDALNLEAAKEDPGPFTPSRRPDRAPRANSVGMDEPVSLYPLDPETALRALLDTPPDPRS